MKALQNSGLRSLLYTLVGALVGLVMYLVIGCPSGTCAITSSPFNSMLYMGLLGFFLAGGCCGGSCGCGGDSCGLEDKRED